MSCDIFEAELQEAEDRHWKSWLQRHKYHPPLLYHYTNASGLLGILSSNRVWASDARFLNDSSELEYANTIIIESLLNARGSFGSGIVDRFLERAQGSFYPYGQDTNIYVVCYSEEGDSLSQWREYAQSGGGYALGFMPGVLSSFYPQGRRYLRLRKVVYNRDEQRNLVGDAIKSVGQILAANTAGMSQESAEPYIALSCLRLRAVLHEYLFCFKYPSFVEEKEWRLISISSTSSSLSDLGFRATSAGIVPYVSLELCSTLAPLPGKLPLKQIRYGPTLHPFIAQAALEALLQKYEYMGTVKVDGSETPLRA